MKQVLVPLVALLLSGVSAAATLEIEVEGLPSREGQMLVAVYDKAETWMKKPLRANRAVVSAEGLVKLRFEDLPDGDYAYAVIHDANNNGKLDMNVMGIPTEAYAFSNKASGSFGPPKFEAARFSLQGDAQQRVSLK